jgi:hypothetical protein
LSDERAVLQIAIDGKIIFYYTTSGEKKLGWGSIIIGGILIPIVIRYRIKYAEDLKKL